MGGPLEGQGRQLILPRSLRAQLLLQEAKVDRERPTDGSLFRNSWLVILGEPCSEGWMGSARGNTVSLTCLENVSGHGQRSLSP